ncbi:MAG TPA: N-acetylglucosamine-6-phosphate deacetylase [Ktedonobacterales bacterium]|nr:N-acetylglucosamine-6-phosphate deacetylase [Ktedonobacterales bacterium]
MRFTLRGARLVDAFTDIPEGDVTVEDGRIVAVGSPQARPGTIIDAAGMLLAPGFIDVHTHGGGGFNLHTTEPEEIHEYARWAPSTGVTSFLIGVVGTPGALPRPQLEAAVMGIQRWQQGAEPLGIHLEGPYINERRRGAHLPSWLRMPATGETARVLSLADAYLRIVTLAPELPGASQMIRQLVDAGVRVSIGHTDATYEQAVEAIQLGASHMTHCCNAMRPLHQRDPGPLSAVAQAPQVLGELIADGVHVHPAMMYVVVKILGPARTVVITDALAAAGLDDASFEFAGQPARVISGVARLADGTITGSVLTMDRALRNILRMTPVTLREAVGMLTRNPAQAANALERKGSLGRGCDADLVLLDQSLGLQATFCRGNVAYASDSWQERLAPLT